MQSDPFCTDSTNQTCHYSIYSNLTVSVSTLKLNDYNVVDAKRNNTMINKGMRKWIYYEYNRDYFKKLPYTNYKCTSV